MLLTGGQISAAISSAVVFVFTSALFLSGYILQQRTVANIQAVLHPPAPPTPTVALVLPTNSISSHKQQVLSTLPQQVNWKSYAYAQLVRSHEDVCSTVMMFAELMRAKSPAQKVLLYPAAWDEQFQSGEDQGRKLRTSVRLLQKANRQYKVQLFPVAPVYGAEEGDLEGEYPLARLLALVGYEKVLSLMPTGMVLDGEMLDTLFGVTGPAGWRALGLAGDGQASSPNVGVMLRPSMASYSRAVKGGARGEDLPEVMSQIDLGVDNEWFLSRTSDLLGEPRTGGNGFNATEWYDRAAFVRFDDQKILGPQYDVPRDEMELARPGNRQARSVWEGLYDRFRVERMSVCGLDTEPLPRSEAAASSSNLEV